MGKLMDEYFNIRRYKRLFISGTKSIRKIHENKKIEI